MIDNKEFENLIIQTLNEFGNEISKDPFQYYSEMELHYQFCEIWLQKTKLFDSVFRSYPTVQLYRDVKGKLISEGGGKPAFIDICLKNNNFNYCNEMYIGRDTDEGLLKFESGRSYQLRNDSFSFNEFKEHLDRDIVKLVGSINEIYKGYLIYIIRGWRDPNKRITPGRRNEKHNRFFQYLNEAESYFRERIKENKLFGTFMYFYFDEDMKRYEKMVNYEP